MMKFIQLAMGCWLLLAGLPAMAGSPQLTNLLPVAGQRGQSVEVIFHGERLHDISQVLFHTQGIHAKQVTLHGKKRRGKRVKATLVIAPDAPLGEHQLRLVTRTGVTEMITFQVVDKPIIKEQSDDIKARQKQRKQSPRVDALQSIELGTIVLGRTELEDVDAFAIELKKGQSFSAEVKGIRLGRGLTDSHLSLFDPNGKLIATCDDTARHRQDPSLSLIVPADGRYVLMLRDAAYLGSANNWYLLHVGQAIAPKLTYPLGGQPGQTLQLRMLGDPGGNFRQDVTLPRDADGDFQLFATYKGLRSLSPLAFRVNALTNVLENPKAKNNSIREVKDHAAYPLPVAFNGIVERDQDQDFYKVQLKKGQQVHFRCFARSMGSPLDSVINLFNAADNKHLQGNDDQVGMDSAMAYTVPADGNYLVRVRDHRRRGGANFVYRLEVTLVKPQLATSITRYNRNRPQMRQALAVPQGNRYAALVNIQRDQVTADLVPAMNDLPTGVTAQGLGPAQHATLMPIVFEAQADAPLGASLTTLAVTGQPQAEGHRAVTGRFHQKIPLVIGDPNRAEYYHSTVDTHAAAVTEPIPFKIDVVQPNAPLVHGGKQRLQIKLTRAEGYQEQVRLHMLYRPPGIGAPGSIALNKTDTQSVYEIDANTSVPERDWPMVIVGSGKQKEGLVWASSQLFTVTVQKPFVTGTITPAKCGQGQAVDVVVNLEHTRPWQGQGELKLLGLPPHATAKPIFIKPSQTEARFKVQVSKKTPARHYKTLVCELIVQVKDEPVIHRFGQGGRLRVGQTGANNTSNNAQAKADDA